MDVNEEGDYREPGCDGVTEVRDREAWGFTWSGGGGWGNGGDSGGSHTSTTWASFSRYKKPGPPWHKQVKKTGRHTEINNVSMKLVKEK